MGTRYDMREICARVERRRRERKLEAKQAAGILGLKKWDWSRKVNNKGSTFTLAELAILADALEAPTGWPFVDERLGHALDQLIGSGAAPPPETPTTSRVLRLSELRRSRGARTSRRSAVDRSQSSTPKHSHAEVIPFPGNRPRGTSP